MKCFLLELHVISLESKNETIHQTVENIIILANSGLSSNRVSYPIVIQSYIGCLCLGWEKSLAGCNEQADCPKRHSGEGVNASEVTFRTGTISSVSKILKWSISVFIQQTFTA